MPSDLCSLTAFEIRELIKKRSVSPEEVLFSFSERIDKIDGKVNAFISFDKDRIKDELKLIKGRESGRLYGVPIAVKDNICVEGRLTTCASRILEGFRPPYSATVIDNLRREGAVIIGRANMDEFAFGSSCETSCYGPTRNPWDLERIPGGSSGGAAASVAAGEAALSIGSDTGGSIRQPAALCGVVGMKPTYGRVSRYGLIAFASSLDQIGPFAKDMRDCALLLGAISSYDPKDSTSVDKEVPDFTKALVSDVKGVRIGIPKEYFIEGIDGQVREAVLNAVKLLEGLGAKVDEVSLPHTDYAVSTYYIIGPAEASSNLARFDGVQYGARAKGSLLDMYMDTRAAGFGDEAKRRIILGTYVLSSGYYDAYYLKALKVRTKMREDFEKAFKGFDCIVTPTSPTPAFKIGERIDDPLSMYLSDIFTIPANLTGIPGVSIPCGYAEGGLPIGLQILAKPFNE
ncbi:MAG: Asp-tRNA(Asn)/Glu-tRNA(Gln) amidotransferase subunit GatA, partial [Candidatus Omnitrophota bacterium]